MKHTMKAPPYEKKSITPPIGRSRKTTPVVKVKAAPPEEKIPSTHEELLKEVYKLDPSLKKKANDLSRDALMFLLGAAISGPNKANTLAQVSEDRVKLFTANLRKSKVFVGNKINCDWSNPETGGTELFCDAAVAVGWIERV